MSNTLSIVIDADIARSSGTTQHPISSSSRSLLDNVKDNGHKLAFCPMLIEEWRTHRSSYSAKWLASMIAKRQVNFIKPQKSTEIQVQESQLEPKKKTIASKDSHLIDAALLTDKIITSNDDNARNVFCELSSSHKNLKEIKWFNALSDRDFLTNYLSRQNQVPRKYFLETS